MTRILLVRHGESEWNADGRWQGQADPPLTERGRRQAVHAASALGTIDAIVTSDLERASETGAILARLLGVDQVVDQRVVLLGDDFARAQTLVTDAYRPQLVAQQNAVRKAGPVDNDYWSTNSAVLSNTADHAAMLILLPKVDLLYDDARCSCAISQRLVAMPSPPE